MDSKEMGFDTIAAIATPPGEGGVAVIRLSGEEALVIAAKLFSGPIHTYASHTAHLGKILSLDQEVLDEGLALIMKAPRSFTGEDVVEFHCHGGSWVSRRILDQILKAGARAAGPGEFTLRAFLNGRIDLAQAEAIQQLIGAKNTLAVQAAKEQLQGKLSHAISAFQKELVDIAAILEAWVDFPEEDLEFASKEEIIERLQTVYDKIHALSESFHDGKMISQGFSLCLSGLPNVGKSSLMNALLKKERAIVTEIAGTTRDLLEEEIRLGDLHFRLIDTAGIRQTDEKIEQEGIRRSHQAMQQADLVLLVLDATQPISSETERLIEASPRERTLLVWNKRDLLSSDSPAQGPTPAVWISAKQGEGLDELKDAIHQMIWKKGLPSKEEILITNARHQQALNRAAQHLKTLIDHLGIGISPEFLTQEIRCVLEELGSIIGMNITEEILTAIFSQFCVGK